MTKTKERVDGREVPDDEKSPDEARIPDDLELVPDAALLSGLQSILDPGQAGLEVLGRTPNPYTSSRPSEIVRVQLGGGSCQELFLKYGAGPAERRVHRAGVLYESRVYRDLLQPLGRSVPGYRGAFPVSGTSGLVALVLESVSGERLHKVVPSRLIRAAAWIGAFHRVTEPLVGTKPLAFLRRYDRDELLQWVVDATRQAGSNPPSWLPRFTEQFGDLVDVLLEGRSAVIHGEYYPMNILVSAEGIHPVDWESTGVGPGEIDLASLITGWPREEREACLRSYAQSRWYGSPPREFRRRVDAARLYLCLRMLGSDSAKSGGQPRVPFFEYLRETAEQCGLELPDSTEPTADG